LHEKREFKTQILKGEKMINKIILVDETEGTQTEFSVVQRIQKPEPTAEPTQEITQAEGVVNQTEQEQQGSENPKQSQTGSGVL